MTARNRIAGVSIALAAVALALLAPRVDFGPVGHRTAAGLMSDSKTAATLQSARRAGAAEVDRGLARAAVREIQSSADLRATYEKYRAHPDPTGEVAFHLANAIGDCPHFHEKPVEQLSREMNAIGKAALSSGARIARIERQVQRCHGFQGWPQPLLIAAANDLTDRAVSAGHAGANASKLVLRALGKEDMQRLDAEAIRLLSEDLDASVLRGVFLYLQQRNGWERMDQFGDPAVTMAAWTLLRCNHGEACDDSNRQVMFTCIYYAACDQHEVATSLPFFNPELTPERMGAAMKAVPQLAAKIRERDWAAIGFSK